MAKAFQERLRAAKDKAGFTLVDLAGWFGGVSWQAVSTWLNGRQPKGYRYERVETALSYLETELRKPKTKLPVPLSVKERGRAAYVRSVRGQYPDC